MASPDRSVRVGRIDGIVPFNPRLSDVELADATGVWLRVQGATLVIAARDLLSRQLTIERLAADEIRVERPPEASTSAPQTPTGPPQLAAAASADRCLRSLELPDLRLAPPILGEDVALSVAGHAALAGGQADATLQVQRTDGQDGRADLTLAVTGQPARLRLDLMKPTGALAGALLQRDDRPPLTATLTGDGPLAGWHGRLEAATGALAKMEADLALGIGDDGERFAVRGKLAAAQLLPAEFAPLVGDELPFEIAATRRPDGRLTADEVAIGAAAAHLTGSGSYAPQSAPSWCP